MRPSPEMAQDLNMRPTQAPLNREEQKMAFETLKNRYAPQDLQQQIPQFPVQPVKENKISESESLKAIQQQMIERGIEPAQIKQIEEKIQENKTKDTIKQFYCRHNFQMVNTMWMGFPIKYKICQKCNQVK